MNELSVTFAPLVAIPVLVFAVIVIMIAVILTARAKAKGSFTRTLFAFSLIAILLNPLILTRQTQPLPDQVLMIIDQSESMTIGNRPVNVEQARSIIQNASNDFGFDLVTINPESSDETLFFNWVSEAMDNIDNDRLSAIIVVSDGITHDTIPENLDTTLGVPVHSLIAGRRNLEDREIILERAPQYALVDRIATASFRIIDRQGDEETSGTMVRAIVRHDGQIIFDNLVTTGETVEISFIPKRRGTSFIEIETPASDREQVTRNNKASFSFNAIRDRLRVLLVSGEPYQGARAWRSVLRSDAAVDLIHFTILRPPTSQDNTPNEDLALIPFPTDELFNDELENFDLVIFDRYTLRGVLINDYMLNLVDYVTGGGALLIATGPEFTLPYNLASTPLIQILPGAPTGELTEGAFMPSLNAMGERHPVTANLPALSNGNWGPWYRMVEANIQSGTTIMEGAGGRPLLNLARTGEGRVAQLFSDNIWLWSKPLDGGGPYQNFIRQIAHWLMQEPDLEEETILASTNDNTVTITRRSMGNPDSPIQIATPEGDMFSVETTETAPGRQTATFTATQPGLYQLSDGERTANIAVGRLESREWKRLVPTDASLTPLSRTTGGGIFWIEDGLPDTRQIRPGNASSGRNWIGFPERQAEQILSVQEKKLLPEWLALFLIITTAALAWWREAK